MQSSLKHFGIIFYVSTIQSVRGYATHIFARKDDFCSEEIVKVLYLDSMESHRQAIEKLLSMDSKQIKSCLTNKGFIHRKN